MGRNRVRKVSVNLENIDQTIEHMSFVAIDVNNRDRDITEKLEKSFPDSRVITSWQDLENFLTDTYNNYTNR